MEIIVGSVGVDSEVGCRVMLGEAVLLVITIICVLLLEEIGTGVLGVISILDGVGGGPAYKTTHITYTVVISTVTLLTDTNCH